MVKHKLKLGDETAESVIHKTVFHSIRNKVLQKLVLIWFNAFYSREMELNKRLSKRLAEQGLPHSKENLAFALTPEDIMEIIHCSKRTAIEYRDALRWLHM